MGRSPQGVEGWGEVTALGEKGGEGDLTRSGVGGKGSSLDGSGSHTGGAETARMNPSEPVCMRR